MTDAIPRLNAALSDRYRIERQLGEGGMATVYLADDLRHERKVALKVLKPELAAVVGPERFLAEIRTTANLQHPHILPLFDSGEAGGFLFYVMPYVEGESLRERLDREKQLPVVEAVLIATKVAGALQAAHDRGVIHRDIKPANILLANGEPLVADFGIALAVSAAGGGRLTETGLSLGTPYYMSPEQATGDRDPDARADVYSLGCVLYEMLTGEPPHTGSTAQAVLGKILTADPVTLSMQRSSVPRHVEAVVMQALEKLPADRFASAAAFADKLQDPTFDGARAVRSPPDSPLRLRRITTSAVAVASVAVVAAVWGWSRQPDGTLPPSDRLVRSVIGESRYLTYGNTVTISPDGETVVYVGGEEVGDTVVTSPDGERVLYVGSEEVGHQLYQRRMDDLVATAIPGTEGARSPFFSPDGEWIAFTRALGIEKVRLAGGSVATVRVDSVGVGGGATWHDGWIYFTLWGGRGLGSLVRIPEDGGRVETVLAQDPQRPRDFWWWAHLPGSRSLLLAEIAGREHLTLFEPENNRLNTDSTVEATTPHFIPPRTLVYGRSDGSVLAAPFDPERGEFTGSPVLLASNVEVVNGTPQFAVSASGSLVYAEDDGDDLVWESLDGSSSRPVTDERRNLDNTVGLSPDGSQVAVSTFEGSSQEIRVYDAETGRGENLTRGEQAISPVWSPDGRLTYGSRDRGLILRPPSGAGDPEVLLQGLGDLAPIAWSPTGDHLAYMMNSAWQGWILDPSTGESTTLGEDLSFFGPVDYSPDGSLIALQSSHLDERPEVYVEVLLDGLPTGNRVRVSFEGGIAPRWSLDGRQLYYLRWQSEETETQLVSVEIERSPVLRAGAGVVLATWPSEVIDYKYRFDLHPNGRELVRVRSKPTRRLVLLQNWQALLGDGR